MQLILSLLLKVRGQQALHRQYLLLLQYFQLST